MEQVVIVDAIRTPMGRSKGGAFRNSGNRFGAENIVQIRSIPFVFTFFPSTLNKTVFWSVYLNENHFSLDLPA